MNTPTDIDNNAPKDLLKAATVIIKPSSVKRGRIIWDSATQGTRRYVKPPKSEIELWKEAEHHNKVVAARVHKKMPVVGRKTWRMTVKKPSMTWSQSRYYKLQYPSIDQLNEVPQNV